MVRWCKEIIIVVVVLCCNDFERCQVLYKISIYSFEALKTLLLPRETFSKEKHSNNGENLSATWYESGWRNMRENRIFCGGEKRLKHEKFVKTFTFSPVIQFWKISSQTVIKRIINLSLIFSCFYVCLSVDWSNDDNNMGELSAIFIGKLIVFFAFSEKNEMANRIMGSSWVKSFCWCFWCTMKNFSTAQWM